MTIYWTIPTTCYSIGTNVDLLGQVTWLSWFPVHLRTQACSLQRAGTIAIGIHSVLCKYCHHLRKTNNLFNAMIISTQSIMSLCFCRVALSKHSGLRYLFSSEFCRLPNVMGQASCAGPGQAHLILATICPMSVVSLHVTYELADQNG